MVERKKKKNEDMFAICEKQTQAQRNRESKIDFLQLGKSDVIKHYVIVFEV